MNEYILTLKSDSGPFKLRLTASSVLQAIELACKAENCPDWAVTHVQEISVSQLLPPVNSTAMSVVNFVYFTANFQYDFIEQVWTNGLSSHLRTKFSALSGSKGYISPGDFIHFFMNLSRDNQILLAKWTEKNYHFSNDHK